MAVLAEDFIPLLREKMKLERDRSALTLAETLRLGGQENMHKAITRAGFISGLEWVDQVIVETVKELQGQL